MTGIELRNEQGYVVFDGDTNSGRTLGTITVPSGPHSSSFYDSRLTSGRFFYQLIHLSDTPYVSGFIINVPEVTYDGAGTISWSYLSGPGAYIVYGVY